MGLWNSADQGMAQSHSTTYGRTQMYKNHGQSLFWPLLLQQMSQSRCCKLRTAELRGGDQIKDTLSSTKELAQGRWSQEARTSSTILGSSSAMTGFVVQGDKVRRHGSEES
jgi:hypothetical protein